MRFRRSIWLLALLVLAACNLSSEPEGLEPLVTATSQITGKPIVTITSPESGSEVVVGDRVLISATATDTVGVQRVQLLAGGQIVKTVSSESASGDTTLNVLLDYTPREAGNVNLQVVAYRGAVVSDPANLALVVRERPAQVTSTPQPASNVPVIDPNDPTCRALTNVALNLRVGPSTAYNVITVLPAGTVVPIVGRLGLSQNEWYQVRSGTTFGWVSAPYTTQYGICTAVPIVVPPPSPTSPAPPTSTPAPTLTPAPAATATPTGEPEQGVPDLVISTISGPQQLALGGQAEVIASYGVTITNTGTRRAGQFANVVIKLPNNVEIPLGVVSMLRRGESIILTTEVTFDQPGAYTLQIRADANNEVAELSEVNNSAIYTVNVTS